MNEAKIAMMTCGLLRVPIDHHDVADFVRRSPAVWEFAATSDGYLGHIDEDPDLRPERFAADDFRLRCAITLSFWRDVDSVRAFAYRSTNHADALHARRRWFLTGEWPTHVAWWFTAGRRPSQAEGVARYERLDFFGPTPYAFDLRHPFDDDAASR